jgi:hypothetical protein
MKHVVEMASTGMIYVPNFIKTDMGVQVTLMFYFNNFGISDGKDL